MVLLLIVGFGAADVPFPLFLGLLSFLGGVTFSGVLGLLGRRRRFDEISLPHFAGWGALGGLVICGVVSLAAGPGAELLVVGPVCALAAARSGDGGRCGVRHRPLQSGNAHRRVREGG